MYVLSAEAPETGVMDSTMWVLETEVRSSTRREGALTADPSLQPEDTHSSNTEHAK